MGHLWDNNLMRQVAIVHAQTFCKRMHMFRLLCLLSLSESARNDKGRVLDAFYVFLLSSVFSDRFFTIYTKVYTVKPKCFMECFMEELMVVVNSETVFRKALVIKIGLCCASLAF